MRFNYARERLARQRSLLGKLGFVGEIIGELRKVSWPSREENKRLTTMVVIVAVAMGAILGLVDQGFSMISDSLFF
jgi:preprotein translocase subunit SecE